MNRREMLKKSGVLALVGATGLAAACAPTTDPEVKQTTDVDSTETQPETQAVELSERDKLIVNRTKMTFADPENPTDHELKHTPDISFGEMDKDGFVAIHVILGMKGIIHPAIPEHWIDYLTFHVNDKKISHIENENGPVRGAAGVLAKLSSGDVVKVEAGCNLHGIWENSVTFEA